METADTEGVPTSPYSDFSAEARYAGRLGKHAAVYGAAAFMTVISGLVSVVVFTRFLDPTSYGRLAVFMTTASFVTVAVNLCSLQGTMRRVHGVGGEEETGDDAFDEDVTSNDPRMSLTTGLVLTGSVGLFLFLIAFAWREQLSDLFFGASSESGLFLLAVGAGSTAGVMRLARNILRLQLRSTAYLVVSTVFALGSTALAIPLLAEGVGVSAILIGAIAASAAAGAIAIALLRRDVRAAVSLREAREIMRQGVGYLPLILSFQTLQLADTFLVAGFADLRSAGLYRVAQRIGQPVTYGTSVFQQAWGPMGRDLTQAAVDRKNVDLAITARLVTYYTVFVITLVLVIALFADQLVRLAAPEYAHASLLVPITALSIAGHGGFILAYRISKLSSRWYWMNLLASIAAPVFVGIGALLIIPFGAIGAPIAGLAAWGLATMGMVILSQARSQHVPFESGNLLWAALSAAGIWAIGNFVLPDAPVWVLVKALLLIGWAALMVLTRVVPLDSIRSLLGFARHSTGVESKRHLRERVATLKGRDATLVEEVVRQGLSVDSVAERNELAEEEVFSLTVQALRTASTGGEPRPTDQELGRVILVQRPGVEKDHLLFELVQNGADPIDTDLVVRTAIAVRKGRRRR